MDKQIVTQHTAIYCNDNPWSLLRTGIEKLNPTKIFILVDTNTHEHCHELFIKNAGINTPVETIIMPSGEKNKTIYTCMDIWTTLSEKGADRSSLLINLGGGVVTDLGGFVASIFKRGIEFVNIPTSLLAMVDASIGGKNGVDLGMLKNQIGVVNNPRFVIVDPTFLNTLPKQETTSGFAEMLKHALIDSKDYWEQLQSFDITNLKNTHNLIWKSIEIKNNIVTQDPTELGARKVLNFGHTLGHAIESYCLESKSMPTLLHGEAVAIGIVLATYISSALVGFDKNKLASVTAFILTNFKKQTFNKQDIESIIALLKHDKKNKAGAVLFVLLEDFGKTHINKEVPNSLIEEAFDYYDTF
ncbi:3-dehydroquinate synthase [Flavobacteriaceae bacterium]|nr:3-dehydroquinate synthase [Flavobacteriaceae bacterium]